MMTTSALEPSSTPNWVELPNKVTGMILERVGALEILKSAQWVCTTWRRICKDPAMWKVIEINYWYLASDKGYDLEKLSKQAIDRSCGELIDISFNRFCTEDLLDYVSRCSNKLTRLRVASFYNVTQWVLNNALKRLPHLETLEISYISIYALDIEAIGRNCPQLKSFTLNTEVDDCYGEVHAIANSMPTLRHLELVGGTVDPNDMIGTILNGCPHLESLHVFGCFNLSLDRKLEKLCRERIKNFKFEHHNIFYEINELYYGRGMDLPEDDGMDGGYGLSGGSAISEEDDYDPAG
ncbi:hypothetical protein OSB04_001658 [Centaurea solstitialis]|uniref:F-box domain-containing protein n=1 Tax=Centaurea solstitialis TaxID=347529 RepID=A0AA38U9J5_9ASTR|nr:hypothetical protein OSB04_001658 [Centaurea solstitialis]